MSDSKAPIVKIASSLEELCSTVVEMASARIQEVIAVKGSFHLALTGGVAGALISKQLTSKWNAEQKKYSGLHVWWGDERFVDEESVERNAHAVLKDLRSDSRIHLHQVMASDAGASLEVAASRYAIDLAGIPMDLTLLGVGADGHIASLFPGTSSLKESGAVIAVSNAPKSPHSRVSFSIKKINESASVWLLASGSTKRSAVAMILGNDTSIPATLVHGIEETLLFVDPDSFASE